MITAQPTSASTSRPAVLVALGAGTVLSLALVVAGQSVPILVWVAVLVALAAGYVAVAAARREFAAWRERVQAEATAERAEQRERTRQLHARQREVLAVVDARMQSLHSSLGKTRASLGEATSSLTTTRAALGQATAQVARLEGDNEALRSVNRALRVENADLRSQLVARVEASGEADVVELPRRRGTGEGVEWGETEGDAKTVVELDLQRLASPFVAELRRRHAN
ncbi:MAG: hypothetical protein ACLGHZ_08860 [Actinomycetes bacterium]